MRVYGAYPTEAVEQLHKPKEGFLVLGFAESVAAAMDEEKELGMTCDGEGVLKLSHPQQVMLQEVVGVASRLCPPPSSHTPSLSECQDAGNQQDSEIDEE